MTETQHCQKFWRTIFSAPNPFYIAFYANGKNKTGIKTDMDFQKRISRMWKCSGPPDSMTFISLYNGVPSGEISIGPLRIFGISPEIGYITIETFSHKGVASVNLKLIINFIKIMVEKRIYSITHLLATCHPYNMFSSRTLKKKGFQLIKSYTFTDYGIRDLYEMPLTPQTVQVP
jgi:RimJ/RimL family protein N-acetyltransferase